MGITSITKDGITLSNNQIKTIQNTAVDELHEVQRKQIDYVQQFCKSIRNTINVYVEAQGYRYSDFNIPYTIALIKEEIISWILFDDLHNDKETLELYTKKVWLIYKNAVWSSLRGRDYIKIHYRGIELERRDCQIDWYGDFFKKQCAYWLKQLIDTLCKME